MFLAGPGAPRPSKMEPIADAARLWLLVAVKREAASFWGAHEEQAVRSSSEAAAAAAVEAAKAVEGRLWRLGRRLRGVRSRGAAGGAQKRRGAASGGLPAVASVHAGFHEKSWDRRYVGLHVCAHVCDVRCATSYYSRGALHTGMRCVARRPWLQNHIIRPRHGAGSLIITL